MASSISGTTVWNAGVGLILLGLGLALVSALGGLLIALSGAVLLPPVRRAIEDSVPLSIPRWALSGAGALAFLLGIGILGLSVI